MNAKQERQVALVILEDSHQRIALQLRDNAPHVHTPDSWGIFGGGIEGGEQPEDAAIREIEEELSIALDPDKLIFLRIFRNLPTRVFYVFHYPVTTELDNAILREGQAYDLLKPEQIVRGHVNCKSVATHHLEILNWYWENQVS